MESEKRVHVRDKHGNERWVTPKAVELVTKGYYTILEDNEEVIKEQPKKKEEAVKAVEKEEDFKTVTFDEDSEEEFDEEFELELLREEYINLSGSEKVDKRWKEDKLKEEILKLKEES